ncbi:hypothetical protein, partial [Brucella anthropi]|uniref:hypothetical protein n=1 Tax=Brucella anthropi TaxID=529 RepID=UPI000ABF33B6
MPMFVRSYDEARAPIHNRRQRTVRSALESLCHGPCAADLRKRTLAGSFAIGPENGVWIQHGYQRLEVAASRRGKKGFNELPPHGAVGAVRLRQTLHTAAGAACELARSCVSAWNIGSDSHLMISRWKLMRLSE